MDEPDAVDAGLWHPDDDGDGFGSPEVGETACAAPPGHLADANDCDDTTADVNPSGPEVCGNRRDDDCDGGPSSCQGFGGVMGLEHAESIVVLDECDSIGVAFAGDVDADGTGDLVVGCPYFDSPLDAAYLLSGPWNSLSYQSQARARFYGFASANHDGLVVDGAGDVNGDGYDDVLVGTARTDGIGWAPGSPPGVYVFYGPLEGEYSVADASLEPIDPEIGAGRSFSGLGDVTGDGRDDFAVAMIQRYESIRSIAVVPTPPVGELELPGSYASLMGDALYRVAANGDVTGDGIGDVAIGAPAFVGAGTTASTAGRAYVVSGPITQSLWIDESSARLTIEGGVCEGYYFDQWDPEESHWIMRGRGAA